jgi:hypothetical protein
MTWQIADGEVEGTDVPMQACDGKAGFSSSHFAWAA